METATYEVFFSTGAYRGAGWAQSRGPEISGGDQVYKFAGRFADYSGKLRGTMAVSVWEGLPAAAKAGSEFALRMTGARNAIGFSLVGMGPLGMVIEIDGVRQSGQFGLLERLATRDADAATLVERVAAFITIAHAFIDAVCVPQPSRGAEVALMVFEAALRALKPLVPAALATSAATFFDDAKAIPRGWDLATDDCEAILRTDAWAQRGDRLFGQLVALLESRASAVNSDRF